MNESSLSGHVRHYHKAIMVMSFSKVKYRLINIKSCMKVRRNNNIQENFLILHFYAPNNVNAMNDARVLEQYLLKNEVSNELIVIT